MTYSVSGSRSAYFTRRNNTHNSGHQDPARVSDISSQAPADSEAQPSRAPRSESYFRHMGMHRITGSGSRQGLVRQTVQDRYQTNPNENTESISLRLQDPSTANQPDPADDFAVIHPRISDLSSAYLRSTGRREAG